ncbi:MAG: STAS/SEC14 domain-containing protein [Methylococcaceae bacterium]|nr:STAS/SEC14 domain-containing protein [Methylococcaceae bacterium]
MIEQFQTGSSQFIGFTVSGKLHDEDYRTFVPAVDAAIAERTGIRLFIEFADFHGWDLHAAWDDIQFAATHYSAFDRIAVVGEKAWEGWMARLCKPFTHATVRYFDSSEAEAAWAWLREDR